MAAIPADLIDVTTTAALEEKKHLQRHFARFDILFFLICTLVGLDTIGTVAADGAQGFTWLIFLGVFFFLPYALLTAELGTAFPEEGGSYMWTRLAFGRFVGAMNAVIYWISNPIWVGGSLAILSLVALEDFFNSGNPFPTFFRYAFALLFIWTTIVAAILSFKVGKWIPTIGAFVRIFVLGFFTLSVIGYGAKHGLHGVAMGDFKPTYSAFIVLVPILFFNYVGFELPSAAGEEMKNAQRDVPFTVFRSMIGTVLLYGGPILAILLVLPQSAVTSLGGFLDAVKAVFTIYGGHVNADGTSVLTGFGKLLGDLAAIALVLAFVSSGTTWVMGADRCQAIACLDGAGPRRLGRFSPKFGTPINVNLASGVISTIIMVLAFTLTHGDAAKYFVAVLGLAISTTTISYMAIFPALYKLRRSHSHVERPYRVPGGNGFAFAVSAVTTLWAALATIALLYPGFGTSHPNTSLPDGFTRSQYELSQLIPLAIFLLAGVAFYLAGSQTRKQTVRIPFAQELAEDAAAAESNTEP